jgi:hypothetical protein
MLFQPKIVLIAEDELLVRISGAAQDFGDREGHWLPPVAAGEVKTAIQLVAALPLT